LVFVRVSVEFRWNNQKGVAHEWLFSRGLLALETIRALFFSSAWLIGLIPLP